jgi:hypothetical protein
MRYITGVLAAPGTITQLVPPSLSDLSGRDRHEASHLYLRVFPRQSENGQIAAVLRISLPACPSAPWFHC